MNKIKNYKKSILNNKSFIYTKKNNLRKCLWWIIIVLIKRKNYL
jgi:hypothetical protein